MRGVSQVARPSMSDQRGQTWHVGKVILHDGSVTLAFFDTTHGTRFYFQHGTEWYAGLMGKYQVKEFWFDLRGFYSTS